MSLTLSDFVNDVSALLREEVITEEVLFRSRDLCVRMLEASDDMRGAADRETVRLWIGRCQRHVGDQL